MTQRQLDRLKATLSRQSNAELRVIAEAKDESEWTHDAIVTAQKVLNERAQGLASEPDTPMNCSPPPNPTKVMGQVGLDVLGCLGSFVLATIAASITGAIMFRIVGDGNWYLNGWLEWSIGAFVVTLGIGVKLVGLLRRALGVQDVTRPGSTN